MESLIFKNLYLLSEVEKSAIKVPFHPKMTVILGENDTGKSCLIKSIYAAFGADPYKSNSNWQALKVDILLHFEFKQKEFYILRMGEQFALFDTSKNLLWAERGLTAQVGPRLAEMFHFGLKLQGRDGQSTTPPPAFCFLPYYVDQDIGWLKSWSSFANLGQFANVKQDFVYFHAGLRPTEYYEAKGEKLTADKARDEFRIELKALEKAKTRIQSARAEIKIDIRPEIFAEKVEELLIECNRFKDSQAKVQKDIGDLYSERAIYEDQIRIVEAALTELEKDFKYMQSLPDIDVVCPTCGTTHENNFANKFELISDTDTCKRFLVDVKIKLNSLDKRIQAEKANFRSLDTRISAINAILETEIEEVKLRDLIEGESERRIDETFKAEKGAIEGLIGEQQGIADRATVTMNSYTDKKFQKDVRDYYLGIMDSFVQLLKVPSLSRKSYEKIDCNIDETGSDLPRAFLAYYYAFFHTMKKYSTMPLFPAVIDSPVQQDQDPANAKKILEFALTKIPDGVQLILGSVRLHGADYKGHKIELTELRQLLKKDKFSELAPIFHDLTDKILQSRT